jgi:hypothetical protein
MTTPTQDQDLPPLPEQIQAHISTLYPHTSLGLWIKEYARAAILADRASRVALAAEPQEPMAPDGDSACARSVWWNHKRAVFTTPRQAAFAAWDAATQRAALPQPASGEVQATATISKELRDRMLQSLRAIYMAKIVKWQKLDNERAEDLKAEAFGAEALLAQILDNMAPTAPKVGQAPQGEAPFPGQPLNPPTDGYPQCDDEDSYE